MRWGYEVEVEDPFEQESFVSLMPKTFEGLVDQQSHQDSHVLLLQQALKKTEKDTQQANAILTSISKIDTTEIYGDTDRFWKAKSEQSDYLEEMAQEPVLFKENIPPDENLLKPRIRREGSGRQSTRQPFTINSRLFGSNINEQKNLRNLENVDEFFAAAERQETAEALLRKMQGQKSPLTFYSQQSSKSRVRRQGTGRRTISKKFDVKLLGSTGKYAQLDGELLEVEEEEFPSTFTGLTGQDSDICMETADKSKDVSVHESGNEEYLFEAVNDDNQNLKDIRSEGNRQNIMQANDQLNMAHHLNPGQEICSFETEETVNMPPKSLFSAESALNQLLKENMNVDGKNKNQAPFSTSGAGMCDSGKYPKVTQYDIQCNLSQSQAESSNAVHNQSLHADEVKTIMQPHQIPTNFHCPKQFSVSGHAIHDNGKPYLNDLQYDMGHALPDSQTESSDTIHKKSLSANKVKPNMQPHQIMRNSALAGYDRTPFENFCRKANETCSPLTSPTPPSKISAAFKSRRKRKTIVEGKSTDACIPPVQNRDEEMAKDYSSSLSRTSTKSNLSKKGQLLSKFYSAFNSQREHGNAVEGKSRCIPPTDNRDEDLPDYCTNSPSHILRKSSPLKQGESCGIRIRDEELPKYRSNSPSHVTRKSSPLKQGERCGIRRLTFDSPLENPSEYNDKNEKVEMARTDDVIQNVTLPSFQKATEVESTGMSNCNALASGHSTVKKDLISAAGWQTEESPVVLQNKRRKKVKRQSKNTANKGGCNGCEEDITTSKEVVTRNKKNKRSDFLRRQSLAGAGTLWKSGVRRSTRIRSRPLEYWRGERFLYGRIHETLTTVIGIKYSSPGTALDKKKDASRLKVKSYVDDEYSHLVDYAAAY